MLDGGAASVTAGLTGSYITPYALNLQATTQQIGYLASFPNFANMLVQLLAPLVAERAGSRKKFILIAVFIQAILYFPILLIPFIFQTQHVWWLILLFTLSTAAGGIVAPPWGAMMADLVPGDLRGSYFGLRNRINGFIALLFSFVSGGLLQVLTNNTRLAFAIILAGAGIARLVSVYYLYLMDEPHPRYKNPLPRQSIWQISKDLFHTNVGRFIVFVMFLTCAQNIGAPFFSPYMLRDLQINYMDFQIIHAASAVMQMLVVTWWGRHADRAGNIRILQICALMIPFIPMLWLVSSSVIWMSLVQLLAGFTWAGFNLCAGLFIYDATPQENRTRYIAIFGALNAFGAMVGAFIGGQIGPHLPQIFGSFYLSLFLLSGILRLVVVIIFFRRFQEVREVAPLSVKELIVDGLQITTINRMRNKIGQHLKRNSKKQ